MYRITFRSFRYLQDYTMRYELSNEVISKFPIQNGLVTA